MGFCRFHNNKARVRDGLSDIPLYQGSYDGAGAWWVLQGPEMGSFGFSSLPWALVGLARARDGLCQVLFFTMGLGGLRLRDGFW